MLPGGQDNCFTVTEIHHPCPSPKFNPRHKVTGRASSIPRVSKASCLGLQKPLPSLPIPYGCPRRGDSACDVCRSSSEPGPTPLPASSTGQGAWTGQQRPKSSTNCCVTLGQPLSLSVPQHLDKKVPQAPLTLTSMTIRYCQRGAV